MDMTAWVVYTLIAAVAMAASLAHYRFREPDGRGRTLLGFMRGFTLALVVLLLFDPRVPAPARAGQPVVALVDASLSMSLSGEDGVTRWEMARELLPTSGPDRIVRFGTLEGGGDSAGADGAATGTHSRLAPALRAALEAGARRVVVITDGALEDAEEVRRLARESTTPIELRTVGDETRANLALETVDAAAWLQAGEPAAVRFTVRRSGGAGPSLPDSVTVTLKRGDRTLARTVVATPSPRRGSSGELRFRPEPTAGGLARLDVEIESGGAVEDDDVRPLYIRIAEEPAGVALVSLRPDQEPRFLVPVLERAAGLPVRGWIRLRDDRFLRVDAGPQAGTVTESAAVRRALTESAVVVLHGVDAAAPAWARTRLGDAERLLIFPADPVPGLPVAPGSLREGDWYVAPNIPSSPVAPLLAGVDLAGVPPLIGLRPLELPPGYFTPLDAREGRRGEALPVAAMGTPGGRRVVVALGEGYWRWAFSGEEGRAAYDRLWSAVASWLLEDVDGVDREVIRPVSRAVPRGEAVEWRVRGAADSVAIVVRPEAAGAEAVMDTTVAVADGRARTAPLPPGHYRYRARADAGESVEGAFTVESYSPELTAAPVTLDELAAGTGGRVGPSERRPLRTVPWVYILILALLSGEWVLRRRWGLR